MLNWSAAAGHLWTRPETDRDISEKIGLSVSLGEILAVSHAIAPDDLPSQIVISSDLSGTTLSGPDLLGCFPIVEIGYLLDQRPGVVTDFNDIPPAAEDITSYRKLIAPPKRYNLTVTVVWRDFDTQRDVTEIRDFQFYILPNYTPGRDRLVEEVDARRRS